MLREGEDGYVLSAAPVGHKQDDLPGGSETGRLFYLALKPDAEDATEVQAQVAEIEKSLAGSSEPQPSVDLQSAER